MDKRKDINRTRKMIVIVLLLLMVCAALITISLLERRSRIEAEESYDDMIYQDEYVRVRYENKWYRQNPKLETMLLLGVDDFAEDGEKATKQSDFVMLIMMDKAKHEYRTLQLNRDTITDVPQLDMSGNEYDVKRQQLALSFAHSNNDSVSAKNTMKAVSNLLYGIDIDHYVYATMDIVPIINDLVGGVPVYVKDDFSNVDPSIVMGTEQVLHGDQALHFVRARKSMNEPTNLARMERQEEYIKSLHNQAIKKVDADNNFVFDTLLEISDYFGSDCSVTQLSDIFEFGLDCERTDIIKTKGETVVNNGYMEFHVDEDALKEQVIELFFVEE